MAKQKTPYHQILTHWLFVLAASLFLLNQIAEKYFQIFIPFWHAYGDDLLCMPVVLSIALYIQRRFTFRNPNYVFSKPQIIFALAYYAFVLCHVMVEQRESDEVVARKKVAPTDVRTITLNTLK